MEQDQKAADPARGVGSDAAVRDAVPVEPDAVAAVVWDVAWVPGAGSGAGSDAGSHPTTKITTVESLVERRSNNAWR